MRAELKIRHYYRYSSNFYLVMLIKTSGLIRAGLLIGTGTNFPREPSYLGALLIGVPNHVNDCVIYHVNVELLFHKQFCELCDKDCPCETSKSKPNCKICKVSIASFHFIICFGIIITIFNCFTLVDKVRGEKVY